MPESNIQLRLPAEFYRFLGLHRFVCLDFETTGLDPQQCEIIEIGAVKIVDGQIDDTFESLVGIHGVLPEYITNLTGIRPDDLAGQLPIDEIIPPLLSFLEDLPVVAHNLSFDLSFLQSALLRLGQRDRAAFFDVANPKHIDLLLLSRLFLPRAPNHSLEVLARVLGFRAKRHHRAFDDVILEVQILDALLRLGLRMPPQPLKEALRLLQNRSHFLEPLLRRIEAAQQDRRLGQKLDAIPVPTPDLPPAYNVLHRKNPRPDYPAAYDEEDVLQTFAPGSTIERELPGYEFRGEQVEMARAVWRAYEQKEFLMVEAGTGTGKSWAYLVPAIFWAASHPLPTARTILSTNTKNLQDQIFFKDIPFLHKHLPVDFQAVMLKGRRNYICLNRWKQFLHGLDWTVERNVLEAVLPLIAWVGETQTGDIEETGAFNPTRWPWIWAQIRSETGFCRNPQCAFSNVCFVQRVRRAAKTADLVVVNHALLLSDLGSKNRVLAEYSNLIVDEAHNLENAATESLGMEWSYWSLSQFVSQLALAPEDPRCPWKALHAIRQSVRPPHPNFWETLGRQISDSVEESAYLLRKNGELFNVLFQQLSLREVWSNGYPAKIRYRNWMAEFPEAKPVTEELLQHLTSLRDLLQGIRGNLAMVSTRGLGDTEVQAVEELRSTASGFSEGISELLATLSLLTTQNSEEFVYWIDAGNGKDPRQMRICCAPLDVSDLLYENLFERLDTVVFTSATLAVGGSFDHFESRTGINRIEADRRVHKILGSPFDFHRQVRVLIPRFIPSPRDDQFIQVGIQIILRAVRSARRATLALFTSYQMLDRAYEALRDDLRKEEIAVLAQGKSGSRRNLVQMMKEGRAHVLLGTQSFWEGVDLPGEALELLIITKLPFDVPSEPIVEARAERLEKQGKSSFYEYILPNAVLKFRQGFGRLIRSRSDRGVVILLDSRILMSRYGSLFYHSLPVEPEVISDMEELEQKVATWFHQDNGDRVLIYSYEE